MTKEKLLAVRKEVKSSKPKFKRAQVNQFAKLKNTDAWRKPKGMGNKIRRRRRGLPKMPSVGYGSPSKVRGLNKNGLEEFIVSSVSDLEVENLKDKVIVISRTLGARKKLELLKVIKQKKLNIANVKSIDDEIKNLTKIKKKVVEKKSVENKTVEKKEEKEKKGENEETKKKVASSSKKLDSEKSSSKVSVEKKSEKKSEKKED